MESKKSQNERKTVRIEMRKKPQEVSGKCHKGGSNRDNVSTDSKNQKISGSFGYMRATLAS